jgi:hypothetical protein
VSLDIFLQRFGPADPRATSALLEALESLIQERGDGWAVIRTTDGAADVYGRDLRTGFMVNHASGRIVWDVLFELARIGGLAIMPIGCPTVVTDPGAVHHLPPDLLGEVVVVSSGADLLRLIESA